MKTILIFISLNLLVLVNLHAQIESLYKPDRNLRIDSSFHLSSNAYEILKHNFKTVVPSLYSATVYPELMRENALEGIVIASITVHADLTTSNLRIEKSSNDAFNAEVLKSLKSCTNTISYHLNPKKGQETYYFPFVFKLKTDNWEELMKTNSGITIETKGIIKQSF